jgi:hypothetical protein
MLRAWAASQGISIADGTLNLCADRTVVPTSAPTSLRDHAHLAEPAWRRTQAGFDPRLYPIRLQNAVDAWLFRWCDEEHLRAFVGDPPNCAAERHCEIIARERLRTSMELSDDDILEMVFV